MREKKIYRSDVTKWYLIPAILWTTIGLPALLVMFPRLHDLTAEHLRPITGHSETGWEWMFTIVVSIAALVATAYMWCRVPEDNAICSEPKPKKPKKPKKQKPVKLHPDNVHASMNGVEMRKAAYDGAAEGVRQTYEDL